MRSRKVFDQFPLQLRLLAAALFFALGMMTKGYLTEYPWIVWPFTTFAVLLVLIQESLTIDFDRGMWVYRRGLWPLMARSYGSFDALYGIEITKKQFETRDGNIEGVYISNYTANLCWTTGSPGKKALYTGRSFNAAAYPAAELAKALGIPVLLDRDMRAYDQQLAEVQAEVVRGGGP